MLNIFVILFFSFCSLTYARSIHDSKTLVIYDRRLVQIDETSFLFNSLESRAYDLKYLALDNETTAIDLYDGETRLYDNLMILPVKGKILNKRLTAKDLLKFYNDGGDIFAVTSPDAVSEPVRLFLNELGIYPSPKDHLLVDYFQDIPSITQLSADSIRNQIIHEPSQELNLVFSNSSAALLENREQIIPIFGASRTSFTQGKGKEHWTSGSQGFLSAAFQSLKNSRVGWLGSTEFLSDKYQKNNGAFIQDFLKWVFHEKNVIEITMSSHSHADNTSYELQPYKIKDLVKYEIGISEWNGEEWVPFLADDLQFELKMIDPYYRLPLAPSKRDGAVQFYTTGAFNLPDHHGVYTFQVDYKRPGLSFIQTSDVKAIRHLAHDEYPRSWSISNSRVYLATILSLIFVWVIFLVFFVTTSPINRTIETEKKNN